jgi:hypothetical protein
MRPTAPVAFGFAGRSGSGRSRKRRSSRAQPPAPVGRLHGRAEIGRSTRGDVYREIRPGGAGGSEVTLTAVPERLGAPDAFLLAAGGRRWLCRLFGGALGRLDAVLAEQGRD